MYKKIIDASIIYEKVGAEFELRYFIERAKENKTQTIISTFLKHSGQTEREAEDLQGIFADVASELTK